MNKANESISEHDSEAPDFEEHGWTLSFPGLSEARANRILKLAEENGESYNGYTNSPDWFFTLTLDRSTAQWLTVALGETPMPALHDDGDEIRTISPAEARAGMQELVDELKEFLAEGKRYPIEG